MEPDPTNSDTVDSLGNAIEPVVFGNNTNAATVNFGVLALVPSQNYLNIYPDPIARIDFIFNIVATNSRGSVSLSVHVISIPIKPQILQTFNQFDNYGGTTYDLSAYFSGATSFTLGSPATNLDITTSYFYYGPGGSAAPVTLLDSTTLEVNVVDYSYNFVLATISGNTLTVNWSGIGILYKINVIAANTFGNSSLELIVNDIFNS